MTATETSYVAKRYRIESKLGQGGMGAVYKVYDRLTAQTVALKRVLIDVEVPGSTGGTGASSSFHVNLSNEFRTLASVRHPNIISVLDYGFDENHQPYFTMSLVDDPQTLAQASSDQPLATQTRLMLELLQALHYLHRRDILHRDLKPSNILVDGDGRVQMLDFGLSLASSLSMSNAEMGMVGTLAYMAPELFMEEDATIASDLYAFGIVAYEMLAGELPFVSKNMALMFNMILNNQPNTAILDAEIAPIIDRLLSKTPEDRYQSAADVIHALCEATKQPVPAETVEIRESFLQTAPMIERKEQLAHLRQGLSAATDGNGSIQLVSGESGVGKSRLIEELRVRALIKGVLVLRGQAISEGSSPFQVWHNVLRPLILYTDLSDDELSILKSMYPNISALVERDIADTPPPPDPNQPLKVRLFSVISALMQRQTRPVLILLEDLHWADSESREFITTLNSFVENIPVYAVGTYADDEAPNLAQELGGLPDLKLNRLSQDGIAELSRAILGAKGNNRDILNLLQRETDGNALFLVEVVRTLAEEVGHLDDIAEMALPERLFVHGIQSVIANRLARISEEDRQLLQYAAIAGRELDLGTLAILSGGMDIEAWLTNCANSAVLETVDGHWQFAHNQLREALLAEVADSEKAASYGKVARAIEMAHPNSPEHYATLAHLWHVAGNDEKEQHNAQLAGLQAYQLTADSEAIQHLERALELLRQQPESFDRSAQELAMQVPLSTALMRTRGYSAPEVEDAWVQSRNLCSALGDPPETVGVLFGLCGVYMVRGDHHDAIDMDEEIMALAPKSEFPDLTMTMANYTCMNNHIAVGDITGARELANVAMGYYSDEWVDYAIASYGVNPSLNIRASKSTILHILGYPDQARETFTKAFDDATTLNHPFTLSSVLSYSWLHQLRGDVETTLKFGSQLLELATEYSFGFHQLFGMGLVGWAQGKQGNLEQSVGMIKQLIAILDTLGVKYMRNYFSGLLAEMYIEAEQLDDALATLTHTLEQMDQTGDRFYEPEILRLIGTIKNQMGAPKDQVEAFFNAAVSLARERSVRLFELRATTSLARLWHAQGDSADAHALLKDIYDWFTEGHDTPDLQVASTLLAELASA